MNVLRTPIDRAPLRPILLGCLAAVLAGCQSGERPAVEPVYSVNDYDPARNPVDDLATTIREAQAGNKRILLQVGGQWCGWCHKLDRFVKANPAVAAALREHFIIMKVNYSDENENAEFLAQYPEIPGYPHLYVLESDGTLLHSQPTAELEEGPSYSEPAILAFLKIWSS